MYSSVRRINIRRSCMKINHLEFKDIKIGLPELKLVIIRPEDEIDKYIYSLDIKNYERVGNTWDLIEQAGIEYGNQNPDKFKKLKDWEKFFYGIVRSINVAHRNQTWSSKLSLYESLKRFGESNIDDSEAK